MQSDTDSKAENETLVSAIMPKYMYSGNYTAKGATGLLKDGGTARYEEAKKIASAMGGSIEAYYWCYGDMDFMMIINLESEEMDKILPSCRGVGRFQRKTHSSDFC